MALCMPLAEHNLTLQAELCDGLRVRHGFTEQGSTPKLQPLQSPLRFKPCVRQYGGCTRSQEANIV